MKLINRKRRQNKLYPLNEKEPGALKRRALNFAADSSAVLYGKSDWWR